MAEPLAIGVSARLLYPEPGGTGIHAKTLHYLEQSVAHWLMARGAMVFMIPSHRSGDALPHSHMHVGNYAQRLDGLVLQGGSDIAPLSYGEAPIREEWAGDRVRDVYELELFQAFLAAKKPVLGICRGAQLINVAFGGTLYQDIANQLPGSLEHRDGVKYDRNFHSMSMEGDGHLARLYPGCSHATINTIHHQAIKALGQDLSVEARSEPDGIIEAIRWQGPGYVFGVQWHPEFHDPDTPGLLDGSPILDEFLDAARQRANVPALQPE
jgi:putative glutamine amidotransferase